MVIAQVARLRRMKPMRQKSADLSRATSTRTSAQFTLARPTTVNDLVRIVNDIRRYPSPIRVTGSGSTSTRCADAPGGTIIDLAELNRILRIEDTHVTVQPGITLVDLADALHARGLELTGGFDLANRTVGGAISAAGLEAAGAGAMASFISSVQQIKFITADGQKRLTDQRNENLLRLFRMSYGLLGIAYEVTLSVQAIRSFSVRTATIDIDDIEPLLKQTENTQAGLKFRLLPFRKEIVTEIRDADETNRKGTRLAWRLKSWTVNSALPSAAFALAKTVPFQKLRYPIVDSLSAATNFLAGIGTGGSGSLSTEQMTQTNLFTSSRQHHSSWAFPAGEFSKIANAFCHFSRQHFDRTGFRCDLPAIGYYAPMDKSALLSPSFNGPIVSLTSYAPSDEGWRDYSFELAEFSAEHGAIPMFSLSQHTAPEIAARAFGQRLAFLRKARLNLDREDRFLNPYFAGFMSD